MSNTTQKKQTTSVAETATGAQNNTQTAAVQTPATQTTNRLTADDIKSVYSQMQNQANQQVDYSVQKGVADLERAQADAQQQFAQQQRQVNIQTAQARDQQALYAAARGDRGGITARQYNSIANTAANNRMLIEQQRQKLATDTARQIADLRAQGEFEKANNVLQIAQQQLAQLWELQQYEDQQAQIQKEFDYQVSQDKLAQDNYQKEFEYQQAQDKLAQDNYLQQFEYQQAQDKLAQENYLQEWLHQLEQDKQAQSNYETEWQHQLAQDKLAQENYEKELSLSKNQTQSNQSQQAKEWAYSVAMDAIQSGVVPTADILSAAGISTNTAKQMAALYAAALLGVSAEDAGGVVTSNAVENGMITANKNANSADYSADQVVTDVKDLLARGATASQIKTVLAQAYRDGVLDDDMFDTLVEKYARD